MNTYPHFRLVHRAGARRSWTLELSFDLERKAWNIPRGAMLYRHERHLAVEIPDNIADPATIDDSWDAGPAELRRWTARHIVVVLHGAKLRGCYSLVRLHNAQHAHWLWVRVNPRAQQSSQTRSGIAAPGP